MVRLLCYAFRSTTSNLRRLGRTGVRAILLWCVCTTAMAQSAQPGDAAFDKIGHQAFDQQHTLGLAFAVVSHGRVVFAKGYGVADHHTKAPVTPDTRFAIGSLTKQFTAVSILMLVARGKLSLEDKLEKFVPGMPNADKITVRMLLNQDSGLHNSPSTADHPWPLTGPVRPEQIIQFLKTDKPDFAPGTRWAYSNTNYTMLAQIVARTSGLPYGQFLSRNIFGPLGMAHSGNGLAAQPGTAQSYLLVRKNTFAPIAPLISLDLYYGAGSIVSTASDLARWDMALMNHELLSADLTRELWTVGRLSNGKRTSYAMGFFVDAIGSHRVLLHNGWVPGAGGYCFNAIFPDDSLAVIVLSNAALASFQGIPEKMIPQVLSLYDPKIAALLTSP
jgi:D-alanyl-D-alanine carboxypeptidase